MLIKYVTTWNELALAYQLNFQHADACECFATAISIYEKIHMTCHFQFALSDYLLSRLLQGQQEEDSLFPPDLN